VESQLLGENIGKHAVDRDGILGDDSALPAVLPSSCHCLGGLPTPDQLPNSMSATVSTVLPFKCLFLNNSTCAFGLDVGVQALCKTSLPLMEPKWCLRPRLTTLMPVFVLPM